MPNIGAPTDQISTLHQCLMSSYFMEAYILQYWWSECAAQTTCGSIFMPVLRSIDQRRSGRNVPRKPHVVLFFMPLWNKQFSSVLILQLLKRCTISVTLSYWRQRATALGFAKHMITTYWFKAFATSISRIKCWQKLCYLPIKSTRSIYKITTLY